MKSLFYIICLLSSPVLAQEETPTEPTTRIEADSAAGAVRIIVEGNEVARFTSSGLLIMGDVEYGGVLTDTGSAFIEQKMKAENE